MTDDRAEEIASRKLSLVQRTMMKAGSLVGVTDSSDAIQNLSRLWMPLGDRVAIIGGGLVGLELAEFLVDRGRQVVVLEEGPNLGRELAIVRRWNVLQNLTEHGVKLISKVRIDAIAGKVVRYSDAEGNAQEVAADSVVLAVGARPDNRLAKELESCGLPITNIRRRRAAWLYRRRHAFRIPSRPVSRVEIPDDGDARSRRRPRRAQQQSVAEPRGRRHRPPRIGRNPKTGETVAIPGEYIPHFKAGKELRDRVDLGRPPCFEGSRLRLRPPLLAALYPSCIFRRANPVGHHGISVRSHPAPAHCWSQPHSQNLIICLALSSLNLPSLIPDSTIGIKAAAARKRLRAGVGGGVVLVMAAV